MWEEVPLLVGADRGRKGYPEKNHNRSGSRGLLGGKAGRSGRRGGYGRLAKNKGKNCYQPRHRGKRYNKKVYGTCVQCPNSVGGRLKGKVFNAYPLFNLSSIQVITTGKKYHQPNVCPTPAALLNLDKDHRQRLSVMEKKKKLEKEEETTCAINLSPLHTVLYICNVQLKYN